MYMVFCLSTLCCLGYKGPSSLFGQCQWSILRKCPCTCHSLSNVSFFLACIVASANFTFLFISVDDVIMFELVKGSGSLALLHLMISDFFSLISYLGNVILVLTCP